MDQEFWYICLIMGGMLLLEIVDLLRDIVRGREKTRGD